MKKIFIKNVPGEEKFYPILDYLASIGNIPENGDYPKNKNVFLDLRGGTLVCSMRKPVDFDDVLSRFEFDEGIIAEGGIIKTADGLYEILMGAGCSADQERKLGAMWASLGLKRD